MKNLIDKIQENNIKIAFKEPQFNEWNLQKFAKEHNLSILDLDPLWKSETKNWYIENLKNNLRGLKNTYE
jgi:ABC-type Zn uptake system ZnuABC Zn-binding protein ZnuA